MKPVPFDVVRPRELAGALTCLSEAGGDARVLAGGQSLLPLLNLRLVRPPLLVDINDVTGLGALRRDAGALVAGAAVRQRSLELDPVIQAEFPLLADAAPLIGRVATRNRGTIAGSLAHADPAAELPAVAVASDAELTLVSLRGQRRVAAAGFFTGPNRTVLETDEIVTAVRFPRPPARAGQAWLEYGRRYGDLPLVGAACTVTLTADGDLASADVVFAGAGPRPWRTPEAGFGELPSVAAAACEPPDDARTSAAHRRRLVFALARRGLELARQRAVLAGGRHAA